MTTGYKHSPTAPHGNLTAPKAHGAGVSIKRLGATRKNLMLYSTDLARGKKYWFSVFNQKGYRPRHNGHSFKPSAEPGDVFELTTKKTKRGNPTLCRQRKSLRPDSSFRPLSL